MKRSLLLAQVLIGHLLFAQQTFQLAPPLLKYHSVFFTGQTSAEIKFAQSGTAVHYTLNNEDPTDKDPVYNEAVIIKNNFTTVKAKAFGTGFIPSETVAVTFIKDGKTINKVQHTPPAASYPGTGSNTLIDNKGGFEQLGSNTWLGYNCDTVNITLDLGKQQPVKKVLLNFLQGEGSWVFLPEHIEVLWFDKKANSFKLLGKEDVLNEKENPGTHCKYKVIAGDKKIKTSKILITIHPVKKIPAWHPAKGEHGWMFIDEIKVY